jgi:hypothetical protein
MNFVPDPVRYRIVVKDKLSDRFSGAFSGMELERCGAGTVLTGVFEDQSQLHGLLDRLLDLGIELVSINAID